MKKMTRFLALILALTMLSTVAVGAEGSDAQGVYNIAPEAGYTLVPLAADGSSITPDEREIGGATYDVYPDTAKFTLAFTGEEGVQYVVFLLSPGETVPKEDKIRYIDQKADGASMSFTLYPDDITEPGTYGIYLSSSKEDDAYKKVASFTVTEKPYLLGDVNKDTFITSTDASLILQYIVGITDLDATSKLAANTSRDSNITSTDASLILQYIVGIITGF